jgi:DNA-binding PucR family transcriptional regulator
MSTKQSAIEAAQQAAIPGLRNNRWDEAIEAAILAYLSALAEDEASVEAVMNSVSYTASIGDYIGGPSVDNPDEVARAVLATLLSRAKEQQA